MKQDLATLEMKEDLATLDMMKEDLATLGLKDRLATLAMTGQLVLWSRMKEGLEVTGVSMGFSNVCFL